MAITRSRAPSPAASAEDPGKTPVIWPGAGIRAFNQAGVSSPGGLESVCTITPIE